MWAMTPRLRILLRSTFAAAAAAIGVTPLFPCSSRSCVGQASSLPLRSRQVENLPHNDKVTGREGPGTTPFPVTLSQWTPSRSPREVGEGLVGLGHLDRVLALGHGLALLAVGGHELVGEAQEHRPARLAAGGGE